MVTLYGRYVYDMLVPQGKEDDPDYTPKPFDGEAESFEVRSASHVGSYI
jgi:hypothetical protein